MCTFEGKSKLRKRKKENVFFLKKEIIILFTTLLLLLLNPQHDLDHHLHEYVP